MQLCLFTFVYLLSSYYKVTEILAFRTSSGFNFDPNQMMGGGSGSGTSSGSSTSGGSSSGGMSMFNPSAMMGGSSSGGSGTTSGGSSGGMSMFNPNAMMGGEACFIWKHIFYLNTEYVK